MIGRMWKVKRHFWSKNKLFINLKMVASLKMTSYPTSFQNHLRLTMIKVKILIWVTLLSLSLMISINVIKNDVLGPFLSLSWIVSSHVLPMIVLSSGDLLLRLCCVVLSYLVLSSLVLFCAGLSCVVLWLLSCGVVLSCLIWSRLVLSRLVLPWPYPYIVLSSDCLLIFFWFLVWPVFPLSLYDAGVIEVSFSLRATSNVLSQGLPQSTDFLGLGEAGSTKAERPGNILLRADSAEKVPSPVCLFALSGGVCVCGVHRFVSRADDDLGRGRRSVQTPFCRRDVQAFPVPGRFLGTFQIQPSLTRSGCLTGPPTVISWLDKTRHDTTRQDKTRQD